jgi:hypothetical protein
MAVAAIPALFVAGQALPQRAGLAWVFAARRGRYFRRILGLTALLRVAFLVLLGVVWVGPTGGLGAVSMLSGFALFSVATGLCVPAWVDFATRLVDDEDRGLFFGVRMALNGVLTIVASAAGSWALARWRGDAGYIACFLAAAVLAWGSFGLTALTRFDPQREPRASAEPSAAASPLGPLRQDRAFRRYLVGRVLFVLGQAGSGFVAVAAADRFRVSREVVALLGMALFAPQILTGVVVGRMTDRWGGLAVARWASLALAVAYGALASAPELAMYVVALLVHGIGRSSSEIADMRLLARYGGSSAGAYYAAQAILTAPLGFVAALLGGLLASRVGVTVSFGLAAAAHLAALAAWKLCVDGAATSPHAAERPT